jgi:hypothetical protein
MMGSTVNIQYQFEQLFTSTPWRKLL